MLRGYRGAFIAIGLSLLALSGQAQEDQQEPRGQTDQQDSRSELTPFPIEIIEDEAEAKARQRHEAEARQRQIDDLIAQRRMAEATKSMEHYSYVQTWVIAIGTFLVFCTLGVSVWANRAAGRAAKAAEKAVEISRELGQRELGAYLTIDSANYQVDHKDFYLSVYLKNTGKTPAVNVITKSTIYFLFIDKTRNAHEEGFPMSHEMKVGSIEPDATQMAWGVIISTDLPEYVQTKPTEWRIPSSIWCDVEWQDIFGNSRATQYRLKERRHNDHLLSIEPSVTTRELTIGHVKMIGYGADKRDEGK